MKLCIAGTSGEQDNLPMIKKSKYILESFYYFKEWQAQLISSCDMFVVDSGAFTFMNAKSGGSHDYKEYIRRYIDFVNKYNIKHFMELDIDNIIGVKKTLELRKQLERETGKQCIPVFHKTRGLDAYIELCQEYDYIAIGTIYEYKQSPDVLKQLVSIARKHGTKVHGLGFTIPYCEEFGFYSVDSTTWNVGAKYGNICRFNGKHMTQEHKDGTRCINLEGLKKYNLTEWLKYQSYLEKF